MDVGIENGIIEIDGKFLDIAVIVILKSNGQSFVGSSLGIELPKEIVEEARRRGFKTTTAGDVLAEKTSASGTDPHFLLTKGKFSRKEILSEAIKAVLSRAIIF